MSDWLSLIVSVFTCLGVLVAACKLWLAAQQAKTVFEDSLSREYRDLAKNLPVSFMLGEEPKPGELDSEEALSGLFHYIDLTNEQVCLRKSGRVSCKTWGQWQDGIKANLQLPAFKLGWVKIKTALPGSFNELRRLEAERFDTDPANWSR